MTSPLLTGVHNTTDAIQNGSWAAPGLSGGGDIAGLGNVANPLSAIVEAGFAFVMPLISFLGDALPLLAGDPNAITSTAQNLGNTGQSVSSLANNYQQAATTETAGWSGTAADGYQNTSGQQATGNAALGQASTGLSSAVTGGGTAVASTLAQVTAVITAAVGDILSILAAAAAGSGPSQGASMAAAIVHTVATAVTAAGVVAGLMGMLLSSAQNLSGLVQQLHDAVSNAEQLITQFTGSSGSSGTAAPVPAASA
jgi:uncharacterized protein YukE